MNFLGHWHLDPLGTTLKTSWKAYPHLGEELLLRLDGKLFIHNGSIQKQVDKRVKFQ